MRPLQGTILLVVCSYLLLGVSRIEWRWRLELGWAVEVPAMSFEVAGVPMVAGLALRLRSSKVAG